MATDGPMTPFEQGVDWAAGLKPPAQYDAHLREHWFALMLDLKEYKSPKGGTTDFSEFRKGALSVWRLTQ